MDQETNPVPPQSEKKEPKRRFMFVVAGLYLASLAAACVLVLRGPSPVKDGQNLLTLARESDSIGWIAIHGPIYNSASGHRWEKGAELWARHIKAMSETKGVKAIILDINSPGGSVGAVQEIYSQILRVRQEKHIPFVALFDDVAASGGYYIASACDQIVAHPGTLTGSIGVIFSVSNLEGLFGKIGYKMESIKSGKHKDMGSPARPLTAEERAILQGVINDAYEQFVAAVAAGRRLPVDQVKPLADGRIYTGSQALKLKLVDAIGDSEDAVALAAKLGKIEGKPRVRRELDKFSDLFEMLDSRFEGSLSGRLFGGALKTQEAGLEYLWMGW